MIHRRGEWLYGFLDWSKGGVAAGWYIGLLVIFALLFVLQKYIHQGRDSLLKRRRATVAAMDGTGALEKKQWAVMDEENQTGDQDPMQKPFNDQKEEAPEAIEMTGSKQALNED